MRRGLLVLRWLRFTVHSAYMRTQHDEPNDEPDGQPNGQPNDEPDGQPNDEPDGQPDGQPNDEPDGQPDVKPDVCELGARGLTIYVKLPGLFKRSGGDHRHS